MSKQIFKRIAALRGQRTDAVSELLDNYFSGVPADAPDNKHIVADIGAIDHELGDLMKKVADAL